MGARLSSDIEDSVLISATLFSCVRFLYFLIMIMLMNQFFSVNTLLSYGEDEVCIGEQPEGLNL